MFGSPNVPYWHCSQFHIIYCHSGTFELNCRVSCNLATSCNNFQCPFKRLSAGLTPRSWVQPLFAATGCIFSILTNWTAEKLLGRLLWITWLVLFHWNGIRSKLPCSEARTKVFASYFARVVLCSLLRCVLEVKGHVHIFNSEFQPQL